MQRKDSTEITFYDVMEKIKELLYIYFDMIVQNRTIPNNFWTFFKEDYANIIDSSDPDFDKCLFIYSLDKKEHTDCNDLATYISYFFIGNCYTNEKTMPHGEEFKKVKQNDDCLDYIKQYFDWRNINNIVGNEYVNMYLTKYDDGSVLFIETKTKYYSIVVV